MFRINTIDPSKLEINMNITKIKSLLSKTIVQVRAEQEPPKQEHAKRKSKSSNTEAEPIQEILANLKNGRYMLKHSRNTKEPHSKLVYLSSDQKLLCWKTPGENDQKQFPLSSILKIRKKAICSGLRKKEEVNKADRTIIIVSTSRNL